MKLSGDGQCARPPTLAETPALWAPPLSSAIPWLDLQLVNASVGIGLVARLQQVARIAPGTAPMDFIGPAMGQREIPLPHGEDHAALRVI